MQPKISPTTVLLLGHEGAPDGMYVHVVTPITTSSDLSVGMSAD